MHLFYQPDIDLSAGTHQLSGEESGHAIRVLRMQTGDQLAILNGKGARITARIEDAHPKRCTVSVESVYSEKAPEYSIHIAVSPTKQMERMEWFVEKATEIGVTDITFLSCAHSERVHLKPERLEKKAVSAMKQSQRLFLPRLHPMTTFDAFTTRYPGGLLAHCRDGEKNSIGEVFQALDCPVLIGPEGDFSEEEVHTALRQNYKMVTLGENRLRTETAALYAVMQMRLLV